MVDNCWAVWTEEGEYDEYTRDLRGLFRTEELAVAFAIKVGNGEVEKWKISEEMPVEVLRYTWTDHVAPDGRLSPDSPNGGWTGHERSHRCVWSHETANHSRIRVWTERTASRYVEVWGTDLEWVKKEFARLVEQVRRFQRDT